MIPTYITPLPVTGSITVIPSGTQNVNVISPNPLPIVGTITPAPAFNATTIAVTVTTVASTLVSTNASRKKLLIQTNEPIFIRLDGVASVTVYSVEMPKKSLYEIESYCGPVTAIKATGSTSVVVTEVY